MRQKIVFFIVIFLITSLYFNYYNVVVENLQNTSIEEVYKMADYTSTGAGSTYFNTNWTEGGTYGGEPYYVSDSGSEYLWTNGSAWYMSYNGPGYEVDPDFEIVMELTGSKNMSDIYNMYAIQYDEYSLSARYDNVSITDDTDDYYVGWPKWGNDNLSNKITATQAGYIADKEIINSYFDAYEVTITCQNLDIGPDSFIQVYTGDRMPEISDGSIVRVLSENGSVNKNGELEVTYVCGLEYNA